ncbi:hypothetical protein RGR602_PB00028 (plasmid) [Rhizobium gallicum bv. gallicum R602sp]|uniref:Uncharacterized protein n=1 Tax=Rhizobium gallicum bv. gallicum R602sp TaxID=1041138 RepID=A0A0B4XA08_9HYPH|nr:hypothetical protein RGR602_PB00028 [Rhizobium gallicum bv. gallicum R602sp]
MTAHVSEWKGNARSNSELERKAGAINALLVRPIGVLPEKRATRSALSPSVSSTTWVPC